MTTETRKRRNYTEDFKRDAVALVTEQGYKPSEAARSLEKQRNVGALSPGVLVVQQTSVRGAQVGVRGSLRAASVRIGPRPATGSGGEVGADGL